MAMLDSIPTQRWESMIAALQTTWASSAFPEATLKNGGDTAPVHPTSQPVVIHDSPEMAEYRALASTLNYSPVGLESPVLDQVLQRLNVEVFDIAAVEMFLTTTCNRLGVKWHWEWAPINANLDHHRPRPSLQRFLYTEPIPLRVLRRMAKLKDALPSVVFYVSRITDQPKADPFLLASWDGIARVIDCWDEPGFTG